jgi:hypothetical protein
MRATRCNSDTLDAEKLRIVATVSEHLFSLENWRFTLKYSGNPRVDGVSYRGANWKHLGC